MEELRAQAAQANQVNQHLMSCGKHQSTRKKARPSSRPYMKSHGPELRREGKPGKGSSGLAKLTQDTLLQKGRQGLRYVWCGKQREPILSSGPSPLGALPLALLGRDGHCLSDCHLFPESLKVRVPASHGFC